MLCRGQRLSMADWQLPRNRAGHSIIAGKRRYWAINVVPELELTIGCGPGACRNVGALAAEGELRYKKTPETVSSIGRMNTPGSDLLSHRVTPAVPSARESLTTVFGMGTGVTSPP